ncbi:photosystem II complex extrinsic protein PsbU [Moorena producens JHB]|uniref:Photosystem II extrinsic protein U n=1 Tax=Moorena producens (strain JHB) TaxID=1454205 RepID=A0A1D9G943_MOOP1|nr:photosystem II complex extrinsic protein PsbU [Moorena producens]AOY84186.1 photosystem II complex extrinsic protein PsbU [Moorena producens JHB]
MRKLRHLAVLCLLVLSLGCLGLPQSAIASPMSSADTFSLNNLTLPSSTALIALSSRSNEADRKLSSEFGKKIDLNNTHVLKYIDIRGFYPGLASKIIQNSPYDSVEDVLNIPGLSDRQKKRLQANLEKFTVTPQSEVYNAGDDRYNPGNY